MTNARGKIRNLENLVMTLERLIDKFDQCEANQLNYSALEKLFEECLSD